MRLWNCHSEVRIRIVFVQENVLKKRRSRLCLRAPAFFIMFIDMDYMRAPLLSFFASHLSVELYYVACKRIYFVFVFHSSFIKFYFVNHDTVISFEFRFGKRNL